MVKNDRLVQLASQISGGMLRDTDEEGGVEVCLQWLVVVISRPLQAEPLAAPSLRGAFSSEETGVSGCH